MDPGQARTEFSALKELEAAAYLLRECFREWRCAFPAELGADEAVLVMAEQDVIEL